MLADRQVKSIVIELHPHTGLPRGRSVHNVCVSVYIAAASLYRSLSASVSLDQTLVTREWCPASVTQTVC